MLALTFQIGAHRLALDIRRIREVVPRVELRPQAGGPPWLAGIFIYRGSPVPVIDLHRLLQAGECPAHLSSRIILVPVEGGLLGLLAAQVAELREVVPPGSDLPTLGGPELGPLVVDNGTLLHLLDLERLLPESTRSLMLRMPKEGKIA
ncbi:MAG: chemotaxis protein CheW [Gemmataceae bacterium]